VAIVGDTTITFDNSMSASDIQELIDALDREIASGITLTLRFSDGTYTLDKNLIVQGFHGAGTLVITGNPTESGLHSNQAATLDFSASEVDGLTVMHCSCYGASTVQNLHVKTKTSNNYNDGIGVGASTMVYVNGNYCEGTSTAKGRGITAWRATAVHAENNYVDDLRFGLYAGSCGILFSKNNDDKPGGTQPTYGLGAETAGTIGKDGTQPAGSTANEYTTTGGQIR